jgi:hypothetical protein
VRTFNRQVHDVGDLFEYFFDSSAIAFRMAVVRRVRMTVHTAGKKIKLKPINPIPV